MKLPYIDLYPGDWLKDSVAGCSLGAQGLWLRLMFIMQESPKRGYLCRVLVKQNADFAQAESKQVLNLLPPSLARSCGCTVDEFRKYWSELVDAGVPSRGDDGIWYSRRMVKDEALRVIRSAAGKVGGEASVKSRFAQAKPQANVGLRDGTDADVNSVGGEGGKNGHSKIIQYCDRIGLIFRRPPGSAWSYSEQTTLCQLLKRSDFEIELSEIEGAMKRKVEFMSQSVERLLSDWTSNLDKARNAPKPERNAI